MIIYKVILKKIESNHANLRTKVIPGLTAQLPVIGKDFILVGEALDPELDLRQVRTTPVTSVEQSETEQNVYTFKTRNSTYQLEVLGEFKKET